MLFVVFTARFMYDALRLFAESSAVSVGFEKTMPASLPTIGLITGSAWKSCQRIFRRASLTAERTT